MNEDEFGRRVARRLDASLDRIEPAVSGRLAAARQAALERSRDAAPVHGLAAGWPGGGARLGGLPRGVGLRRYWLPAAVLAAGMAALVAWNTLNAPLDEDAGLLADELPLNAYLDKGFDEWLAASQR